MPKKPEHLREVRGAFGLLGGGDVGQKRSHHLDLIRSEGNQGDGSTREPRWLLKHRIATHVEFHIQSEMA